MQPGETSPIDASVLEARDELAVRFRAAQPFRHVVIDGFLEPGALRALQAEFPGFSERNARNEHGDIGGKSVRERVRALGPAYRRLDDCVRGREFLALMEAITGIDALLYDPLYVGGGTHENRTGQGLDPHVDFNYHPKYGWHRRLNLILFLNEEWRREWGGNLTLQADPWPPDGGEQLVIEPVANRAVLFETTETSWHGFPVVTLPEGGPVASRRSFALYFYSKARPSEETRAPHSTVYVPPPLPEWIRAGTTLTEDDVRTVQEIFAAQRRLLRWLYEREVAMAETIEYLQESLDSSFLRRTARAALRSLRPVIYKLRRRVTTD